MLMCCDYIRQGLAGVLDPTFKTKYSTLVAKLPLTDFEKEIINDRYLTVITEAEQSCRHATLLYFLLSNVITISGVLIASLVSLEKSSVVSPRSANAIFWIVWSLSIALTMSNKWLMIFNVHKKYILNSMALEKFYTEGWCFVTAIGRYTGKDYADRFALFCTRIEKLKLKYVESISSMNSPDASGDVLSGSPPTDPLFTTRNTGRFAVPKIILPPKTGPTFVPAESTTESPITDSTTGSSNTPAISPAIGQTDSKAIGQTDSKAIGPTDSKAIGQTDSKTINPTDSLIAMEQSAQKITDNLINDPDDNITDVAGL